MQVNQVSSRLVEKERYFREFSVWPIFAHFNTELWLSNFFPDEKEVAERLLTNFTYFNEQMTDALLSSAIHNYFGLLEESASQPERTLAAYINETAFVTCEGETPHVTDSGHLFARKLRDRLMIPEANIFSPREGLKSLNKFSRFVFVDDFSGSGNQFIETWRRTYDGSTFEISSTSSGITGAYCCCIASEKALRAINSEAPQIILSPAHQLSKRHNAIDPSSSIWDGYDKTKAWQTIKRASIRAGYSEENGSQNDWRGFHALGMTLAFHHSIPDACLPIFFSSRNKWKPLIPRRAA